MNIRKRLMVAKNVVIHRIDVSCAQFVKLKSKNLRYIRSINLQGPPLVLQIDVSTTCVTQRIITQNDPIWRNFANSRGKAMRIL